MRAKTSRCRQFCVRCQTRPFTEISHHCPLHTTYLTASVLASHVYETLDEYGISIGKDVSQNYDGATVMRQNFGGIQALIKDVNHKSVYFHC